MISSAPGTIGEEAVSVASRQVCARQTENMTQREGERPAVFSWLFSNLHRLSPHRHLSDLSHYNHLPDTEL